MATNQLSDNRPDGTTLGQSATDKVAFYGVTPAVQPALAATPAVATTAVSTAAGIYGFTTAAQAASAIALLNALRAQQVTVGLAST